MFYIYSVILFFIFSLPFLLLKGSTTGDFQIAMVLFSIIFLSVSFIFIVTGFFHQIDNYKELQTLFNRIKKYKKNTTTAQEEYDALRKYYEEYIGKIYPDMEKEIFGKIADNMPKELVALLQAYPELKTSAVLQHITDNVSKLLSRVYEIREQIDSTYEDIENRKSNPWIIWSPEIPADLNDNNQ